MGVWGSYRALVNDLVLELGDGSTGVFALSIYQAMPFHTYVSVRNDLGDRRPGF